MIDKDELKEYLSRYVRAKKRLAELKEVRTELESCGLTDDKVNRTVQSLEQELKKVVINVFNIINLLEPESEYRSILEQKYLLGKTGREICSALFISHSKYYDYLNQAIYILLKFNELNTICSEL